jgi:hypothetical protein
VSATIRRFSPAILFLSFLFSALAPQARADAVVLLEEPYSYDGAFAGTGHTAVYLTRVCAASPVMLRRCNPEEHGVVISRYTRIGGHDWIAIPLVPYLYAVEKPDDVPLYADSKLVAFLRDQYRRANLEDIAPDAPGGETPKGDWVQLVGSSYDRTNYGFQVETSEKQDDALIEWLNSLPNRPRYQFVSNNCADFVRDVLNFYYPKSMPRGSLPDLWVSTPKHDARALVKYSHRHPNLEFTHFVIPQVPGTMKRSKPVRGVLESLVRAKKYALAFALFHPFVAAGVETVYLVGDRFNPARNSLVLNADGELQAAPTKEESGKYSKNLAAMDGETQEYIAKRDANSWRMFEEKAKPVLGANGQTALASTFLGEDVVNLGITRTEISNGDAPTELKRGLMLARMRQTLAHNRAPRTSSSELREDWQLLEKIDGDLQQNAAQKNVQALLPTP